MLNSIYANFFKNTLKLCIAAGVVWWLFPHLQFEDYAPFASKTTRLLTILALVTLWGIYNFRLATAGSAHTSEPKTRLSIQQFLHHLIWFYKNRLYRHRQHPWHWFIGPANTGCSTLLAQLGYRRIPDAPFNIDVWQFDQGLAFECIDDKTHDLKAAIKVLRWLRWANPVNRVFFVATPSYLSQDSTLNPSLDTQLQCLKAYCASCQLIIHQADLIPGLSVFFETLSREQREQCCGFQLPSKRKHWSEAYHQAFHALIQQLQGQLIHRLHSERNLNKRQVITEFPLQFARYEPFIKTFCERQLFPKGLNVEGIYWTSTFTPTSTVDLIAPLIQDYLPLKTPSLQAVEPIEQPHFMQALLPSRAFKRTSFATPVALGSLAVALFLGGALYWRPSYLVNPVHNLTHWATMKHSRRLPKDYAKLVQHTLDHQLKTADHDKLYTALKAYLMLVEPNFRDSTFLSAYLQHLHPVSNRQALETWLSQSTPLIHRDAQCIHQARHRLDASEPVDLILSDLQIQRPGQITLVQKDKQFTPVPMTVPEIYTAKRLKTIWDETLPKLVEQSFHVLDQDSKAYSARLRTARLQYLQNYQSAWQDAFKIFKFPAVHTLAEVSHMLADLNTLETFARTFKNNIDIASAPKPFHKQVTAHFPSLANASLDDIRAYQTELQALKTQVDDWRHQANPNQALFQFARLRFQTPQDKRQDHLSRLLHHEKQLPKPFQVPLHSLLMQFWTLVLQKAPVYINQKWAQTVYPDYQTDIAHRYPFEPDAQNELPLNQLTDFFSPRGEIIQFFNAYLKPFINTEVTGWDWQTLNGAQIGLNPFDLKAFMHALMIEKMFFAEKATQPEVHFTLVPVDMSPHTTSFTLTLGDQTMTVTPDTSQLVELTWPEEGDKKIVKIEFHDEEDQTAQLSRSGEWAFFRLLDQVQLSDTDNPRRFHVTFDVNGHAAKFILIAHHNVNPFILGLLHGFSLPKAL